MRRPSPTTLVTLAVLGGITAFLFWQLHVPSLLFLNTTTAGGDTGAHVALPAFMRDHLLPHWRLTGWDQQWYDGFPLFTFYFPLPSLLVVLAQHVIPYNIAFKLVTVAGTFALPFAAWAFGRLWGMRRPGPLCLAIATVPFLFDRTFEIFGGNLLSTLAGEYSFSLSLAIGLLFLGVLARTMRTGRGAGLAAVLLALTGLAHLLPTLFVLVGAAVIVLMHWGSRQLARAVPVIVVGGLLSAFWWMPFLLRLSYSTNMGWQKTTDYLGDQGLFPSGNWWVFALAASGTLLSLVLRRRVGTFLALMAVLMALGFRFVPQSRIWNSRLLPFWVLCLYLLAGVAVAEGGRLLIGAGTRLIRARKRDGAVVVPVAAALAAGMFTWIPLASSLPSWFPVHPTASVVPDWVRWNYSGYQKKASYPEYQDLIRTMASVGKRYGCGRAMWEYESELNRLGTPMALMLLPYWTDDCIGSMEGLLFESAASTPYHFLDQSELSARPSDAMVGLPYSSPDATIGIDHLQMLGVRYYMAETPTLQAQADTDPALTPIATSGPWPVDYSSGRQYRTWKIYLVANSPTVAPLDFEPAVVTGRNVTSATGWLNLAVPWYQDPSRWGVPLASSGPAAWPRVSLSNDRNPPLVPVTPAQVTGIAASDDRISFDVDRVGSPVVVRTSYFPNWQASGATGPYRVTPDLMVVIPTSHHVTLHYGWTGVDWLSSFATLAGLAGLVWLARRRPFPEPEPADPDGPQAGAALGVDPEDPPGSAEAEQEPAELEPVG